VFAYGAFVKLAKTVVAPAEPSVALDAEQVSASMVAPTRIVTALVSCAPQMLAAWVNAFKRCAPSVVAVFPPTALTTVGSLKPSPAPSLLTTVMVAAPPLPARASRSARRTAERISADAGGATRAR
jgi:hypothetical protein